ncbi:hypothetical protein EON64_11960 [archaeon]|nr:MAG: hypothetical protein EON64_11960 [archaeon]
MRNSFQRLVPLSQIAFERETIQSVHQPTILQHQQLKPFSNQVKTMASGWNSYQAKPQQRATYSGQSRKVDKKPWRQEEDAALLGLVAEYGSIAKW